MSLAATAWAVSDNDLLKQTNLAQAALLTGDYDRAWELAEEGLRVWPEDAGLKMIRGFALIGLGRYEDAESDLLAARAAFPQEPSVTYNLAVIAERRGEHREALSYAEEAIARGWDRNEAFLLKAQCLDRLGRRAEARATLETYARKRPPNRDVLLTLAQWSKADGDYDKALQYYNAALNKGPKTGALLAEIGSTYEAAGNREKAVTLYLEAETKGADTSRSLAEFAADYAAAGEFEQALGIYEALVKRHPENAHFLFAASFIKQQLNRKDEAVAGYVAVTKLDPAFAEAYYNLAAIADSDEDAAAALQYYRKFLETSEGRADLAAAREKAQTRLGLLE